MKTLVIASVFVLAANAVVLAGQNPLSKVAVHLEAHNAERNCTDLPVIEDCADIVTTFAGYNFDAMPVFFNLYGITAAEYRLTWTPWSVSCAFTSCSDVTIGNIVWPGDGIVHTWNTCQLEFAIVCGWGWFIADSHGMICPSYHFETGSIGVTDCDSDFDPACSYCSGVFGEIGDDTCDPSNTETSTWGGIKDMFK